MSLAFIIYLIDSLSSIRVLSWVALAAIIVFTIFSFFCAVNEAEDDKNYSDNPRYQKYRNYMTRGFWYIASVALFIAVVPDKKTSYTIFAAHVAQKMYESPESAKLQGKVLTILNKKLDEYIDEMPNQETK